MKKAERERERGDEEPLPVSVRFGCVFSIRFLVLCFGLNILEILVSTRLRRRGRGRGIVHRLRVCVRV